HLGESSRRMKTTRWKTSEYKPASRMRLRVRSSLNSSTTTGTTCRSAYTADLSSTSGGSDEVAISFLQATQPLPPGKAGCALTILSLNDIHQLDGKYRGEMREATGFTEFYKG